jgi:hypothetical protein
MLISEKATNNVSDTKTAISAFYQNLDSAVEQGF